MSTRPHVRVLTAALVVAALALAGCGKGSSSDTSATKTGSTGLDAVSVTGAVGTDASLTFKSAMSQSTESTTVLTKGTGDAVASGDSLIIQTVIADGTTKKTVASSYQDKQPQVVTLTPQVQAIFLKALTGQSVGSRVAIVAPATTIFGSSGDASLSIQATDTVLIVFDIIGKPLSKPDGATKPSPSWAPKVVSKGGVVSGLDFSKTPKPDGKLHSSALYAGTGATVKKGQNIAVRYLGAVYKGKKPFDQNFTTQPTTFQIGEGKVVAGWDKTLVGQKVGSEVILEIPPADGYGKQAQTGIPKNSTLYFVVDILAAF